MTQRRAHHRRDPRTGRVVAVRAHQVTGDLAVADHPAPVDESFAVAEADPLAPVDDTATRLLTEQAADLLGVTDRTATSRLATLARQHPRHLTRLLVTVHDEDARRTAGGFDEEGTARYLLTHLASGAVPAAGFASIMATMPHPGPSGWHPGTVSGGDLVTYRAPEGQQLTRQAYDGRIVGQVDHPDGSRWTVTPTAAEPDADGWVTSELASGPERFEVPLPQTGAWDSYLDAVATSIDVHRGHRALPPAAMLSGADVDEVAAFIDRHDPGWMTDRSVIARTCTYLRDWRGWGSTEVDRWAMSPTTAMYAAHLLQRALP